MLSLPGTCAVVFVAASHQTRLDTRSKARRPIKVGIKGRGRSGRSRDSNPACQCCSSAHLVQCEPDEASSFTNPNVGPGTYASKRLKLDAWSSAVQRGQKCSSPTRRLPSRSWGPIRPRVCSWFRAPIRHECQTAQLKSRGVRLTTRPDPCCWYHGRRKSTPSTGSSLLINGICRTDECGTRLFLKWIRAQDRSPDIPSIPKNAPGPVGIPLFMAVSQSPW